MARNRSSFASFLLLALVVLVGVGGCESGPKTSDRDVAIINVSSLDAMLADQRTRTMLVDVRPAARFAEGYLPGAINLPVDRIRSGEPALAEAQQIVVYASGPTDPLSGAAAKKLLSLGYRDVYDFRGGLHLWKAEGREVAGGE